MAPHPRVSEPSAGVCLAGSLCSQLAATFALPTLSGRSECEELIAGWLAGLHGNSR